MLIYSDYKDFDFEPYNEKVSLILVDPPYNLGVEEWDRIDDYPAFTSEWLKTVMPILKPGGFIFSFINAKNYHIIAGEGEKAGYILRDPIFWAYRANVGVTGTEYGKFFERNEKEKLEYVTELTLFGEEIKTVRAGLGTGDRHFQNLRMEKREIEEYKIDDIKLTTENAKKWDDWWSRLKICFEMIVILQKPCNTPLYENLKKNSVGAFNLGSTARKGRRDYPTYRRNTTYQSNMIWTTMFMRDSFPFFLDFNLHPMDIPFWTKDPFGLIAVCEKPEPKEKGRYNIHFSVKPIELEKYLVRLVTNKGDLVVDHFAGSGTTEIACIDEERECISIEKDEECFNIMEKRVKEHVRNGNKNSLLDVRNGSSETEN